MEEWRVVGPGREATGEEFRYAVDLSPITLIAAARSVVREAAEQLFSRFQWRPASGRLRGSRRNSSARSNGDGEVQEGANAD